MHLLMSFIVMNLNQISFMPKSKPENEEKLII